MEVYAGLWAVAGVRSLWLFDKSRLNEVMIESIRYANLKPLHDDKQDAIGERVVFVLMLNKIEPAIVEQSFINMNHLTGRAAEEHVPNLNRFAVVSPAVEKCNDFIEHIRSRHKVWQVFANLLPMLHGCSMVLIVGEFKCEQITGVEED
jgi:hypothetical protein